MACYKHPPRVARENIKHKNFYKFNGCMTDKNTGIGFYGFCCGGFIREDVLKIERKERVLEDEVIKNGFGHVLIPSDGIYKHLREVVEEKLSHPEHIRLGSPLFYDEMLSIILYTGTDVYRDLRTREVEGDYDHWKVLTTTLESALRYLG